MSVLYTLEYPAGPPALTDAAAKLNLPVSALDAGFGVVAIDLKRHLYAVQVIGDGPTAPVRHDAYVEGPFANPRIEGFGPVRGR